MLKRKICSLIQTTFKNQVQYSRSYHYYHNTIQQLFSKRSNQAYQIPKRCNNTPSHNSNPGKSTDGALCFKYFAFACSGSLATYVATSFWFQEARKRRFLRIESHTSKTFKKYINLAREKLQFLHLSREPVFYAILSANLLVFGAWRIPSLFPHLSKYFLSGVNTSISSMLFCSFSHIAPLHFLVNMYVLNSFADLVVRHMGSQQFTFLYISSALFSSLLSNCFKVLIKSKAPSLGASGAIFGILGYMSQAFPDVRASIVLVDLLYPHSFTLRDGIFTLMLIDFCGLVLRLNFFDHAGHLGGALFGLFYGAVGKKLFE